MDFFGILTLVGGLALFLFGMNLMGSALEKRAGNRLRLILARLTSNPIKGFILGLIVTAIIQSSSATTVMVVGFVNSGAMELAQSIDIIIGSNVGCAITSWIMSLMGIQSSSFFIRIFKPTSLAPIFGLIGIILFMFCKKQRRKDIGMILLGFAVLLFGMNTMSAAVEPLADVPEFANILLKFSNPILGILVGTIFTAIIQSSGASVGILQALSLTGSITYASAIPIILGQNIGTCITALISSVGTSRDARRASMIHLYFNVIGVAVCALLFYALSAFVEMPFLALPVTPLTIATIHTIFKIINTVIFLPFHGLLEKLASWTVRDKKPTQEFALLDERLFITPAIAVEHAAEVARIMAIQSREAILKAASLFEQYSEATDEEVVALEDKIDEYEDKVGSYLVRISAMALSEGDSLELTKLLHMLGDFERMSDHAVNLAESAREMHEKQLIFSADARAEMQSIMTAVKDIMDYTINAFIHSDMNAARRVEPLEETIDTLRDAIKAKHIERLKQGECTIELGFVLTDVLTNLERISDHCSNIAMCILEVSQNRFDIHGYQHDFKAKDEFTREYDMNIEKYTPEDLR